MGGREVVGTVLPAPGARYDVIAGEQERVFRWGVQRDGVSAQVAAAAEPRVEGQHGLFSDGAGTVTFRAGAAPLVAVGPGSILCRV